MATNEPTIVAFDASNLEPVAKALKESYPQCQIVIAGDNDHHLNNNVGVEKDEKAARAVGGTTISQVYRSGTRTRSQRLQ